MAVEVLGVPTSLPTVGTGARVGRAWRMVGLRTRLATVVAGVSTLVAPSVAQRNWGGVAALAAAGIALLLAALVDVVEHRLPNLLTTAGTVLGLTAASVTGHLVSALVAGVATGSLMFAVHLSRGVGLGDVKMSIALGVSALTPIDALVALAVASSLAGCAGLLLRRRRLPLGPFLWSGWLLGLVIGGVA